MKSLSILSLILISLLLTSCNPQNLLARKIRGNWTITSYLLNGEEQINRTYQSIEYDFNAFDGYEGDFTFTATDFEGSRLEKNGEYRLNEEGTQLDLILTDSVRVVLTHEVLAEKGNLELLLFLGEATHEYRGIRNRLKDFLQQQEALTWHIPALCH